MNNGFSRYLEIISTILSLALVFLFLLFFFTPELMLSPTTTTGGDMGSHFLPAHYMKNYLLPEGKLIGWFPNWMAGMPMLQFYFVPPYLLMALLSYVIPLEIAFKLVSVLGVFLLPLCSFYAMRLFGFKFPAPEVASAFSLLLLFNESYPHWGGNIKSTLAGEFSYMISFSLAILFLGALYRGIDLKKNLVPTAALLACVVLTHIYTGIFVTAAAVFFLVVGGEQSRSRLSAFIEAFKDPSFSSLASFASDLVRERIPAFAYLFKLFLLAGLITSFWTVPLLAKLGFSAAPKDVFFSFLPEHFISPSFFVFYVFASVSIAYGLLRKDRRVFFLMWCLLAAVFLMFFIRHVNLLYVRFVPFLYMIPLLLAADGLGRLSSALKGRWVFPLIVVLSTFTWIYIGVPGVVDEVASVVGVGDIRERLVSSCTALMDEAASAAGLGGQPEVLAVTSFICSDPTESPFFSQGLKDVPSWIPWNYEGLEKKPGYETFRELNDYLADAPLPGRVDFEYSDAYNRYGTPRLFEVSPVFSNRSVMEALLLESSLTFPFFYFMQREVSQTTWWPGFPIEMPSFDLDHGAETLRVYNVQYFVASTKETKEALANNTRYRLVESIGEFEVYAVNEGSQYVEVPGKEPILVVTDDWRKYSFDWFALDDRSTPLVFSSHPSAEDLERFRIIILDKPLELAIGEDHVVFGGEQLGNALLASRPLNASCVIEDRLSEEEVVFSTSCPTMPHIVKVSFFPNWQSEAGEKIYLVSPDLMLVFPEKSEVRLFYGETFADSVGNLFSVIGLSAVLYWLLLKSRRFKERVHSALVEASGFRRLATWPEMSWNIILPELSRIPPFQDRNRRGVLVAFAVLVVLAFAFSAYQDHLQREAGKAACSSFCSSLGFSNSVKEFRSETVDSLRPGYAYSGEKEAHNFECMAVCDSSRPDFVYVSNGYVEFDLSVASGVNNTLLLTMADTTNCRSGKVYVGGVFVTEIVGVGKYNWHDFEVPLPEESFNSSSVRVRVEHDSTECYGWDLSEAKTKAPTCRCF